MTVSTHVYSAYIQGMSNSSLSVRGGRISFDETRAPHIEASLDIVIPRAQLLAVLDTRTSPPPRVGMSVTNYLDNGQQVTRVFNLTLRDRDVRHADGVMTLSLASDEALLADYAPLTDDTGAFAFQSSLRSIVNYVLGKAIPGRTLQPTPAHNPTFDVRGASTNMLPDPGTAQTPGGGYAPQNCQIDWNDTTWSISGDGDSYNLYNPSSSDSWLDVGPYGMAFGMQAGRTYTFSATGNVKATISGTASGRARRLVLFHKKPSDAGFTEVMSPQVPTTVNTPTRVSLTATLPEGTSEAFLRAYLGHSGTNSQIRWDGFRLSETSADPTDVGYFDGDTTDTAEHAYEWTGTQDNSPSRRISILERTPDALLWKAGQSAMDFLIPIVQAAGLRLVCDEQRRFTLRNEDYYAADSLSIRHGINLIDGSDKMSRADATWFDAAITTYTWIALDGTQQTATDAFSLTPSYTRLQTFERSTPYPGPGFSSYAVRRAQGRGREVSATAVADWRANAEQPITVVLEGAPTQIGQTSRVEFNLDRDEMTVNTRTTDTPFGAIDLLSGTIDQLAGTIDNL